MHVGLILTLTLLLLNNDLLYYMVCFVDAGLATASLSTKAFPRLRAGFRPATSVSYDRMFRLFMTFLVVLGLSLPQLTTLEVLAFIEYLLQNCMSSTNIAHHIAVIRALLIIYNCDTAPFRD